MTNRIHFVQLYENELCMRPVHRIHRIHHRPIRAEAQLASRGAFGQDAPGWPVFIRLFGTANTNQILVAEEAKAFSARRPTRIKERRGPGTNVLGRPQFVSAPGPAGENTVPARSVPGDERRVIGVRRGGENRPTSLSRPAPLLGQGPQCRRQIPADLVVGKGVEDSKKNPDRVGHHGSLRGLPSRDQRSTRRLSDIAFQARLPGNLYAFG
jgi:hypothetical protein